jgi:hypothetical protein
VDGSQRGAAAAVLVDGKVLKKRTNLRGITFRVVSAKGKYHHTSSQLTSLNLKKLKIK